MKISVRPGKREGWLKVLFDRQIDSDNIEITPAGDVVLTALGADIYTKKATQQFSITLGQAEIGMICAAAEKT